MTQQIQWRKSELEVRLEAEGYVLLTNQECNAIKSPLKLLEPSRDTSESPTSREAIRKDYLERLASQGVVDVKVEDAFDYQANPIQRYVAIYVKKKINKDQGEK